MNDIESAAGDEKAAMISFNCAISLRMKAIKYEDERSERE